MVTLIFFVLVIFWIYSIQKSVKRLEQELRMARGAPMSAIPAQAPAAPSPHYQTTAAAKPKAMQQRGSLEERVGAHWFQWIGVSALILALLFFLKWSFDNGLIGETGRTIIGYLLASAAIFAGDKLRKRYGNWALTFTGGGGLGAFIVTWIALHEYELFSSTVGFGINVLIAAVMALMAAYYGAMALAAFGIVGGFLTPILVDSSVSMMTLLTYVLILDLGIFALSHARQWRILNGLSLVGTILFEILVISEGELPSKFGIIFAIAFMAIFILVPLIYNLIRQQKSQAGDIVILVLNALAHFGIILAWLYDADLLDRFDVIVTLAFAVLFLIISSAVYQKSKTDTPFVLGSISLAVLFTTLAIPLQFGEEWVSLAWSIEGAFLLWIALALRDKRLQVFAWIIMAAAYIWYLLVPVSIDEAIYSIDSFGRYSQTVPTAFISVGFLLFIIWSIFNVAVAVIGLGRNDRNEQKILPFALMGACVLTASLFINSFATEYAVSLSRPYRFIEALALIGGSYVILYEAKKRIKELTPKEKKGFAALGVTVQIVTLSFLTTEFARAVDEKILFENARSPRQLLQVGISILWAMYGTATIVIGIVKNWKPLRLFSIILLLIAIAKLTLIDLFELGSGARVIGFTVLGALLVSASFLYQRKKEAVKSFFVSSQS